jgi:hypothetical protein
MEPFIAKPPIQVFRGVWFMLHPDEFVVNLTFKASAAARIRSYCDLQLACGALQ